MIFSFAVALGAALALAPAQSAPIEALDAVTEDGALIYVAADGAAVHAMDLATGSERWQAALPGAQKVQAAVLHKLAPHRLLLQVPGHYDTLDTSTGLLSSRTGPQDWTFVWRGGGACALRSSCVLQPISCEDGRALGPPFEELSGARRFGEDQDSSPVCTSDPAVLGVARGLSLYIDSHLRGVSDPVVVLAVDRTGHLAWRSATPACSSCAPLGSGVATDGFLCWTTELDEGRAVLRGFACATGRMLFTRELPQRSADDRHVVTGWVPAVGGLLFVGSGRVQLISRDGKDVWSRATAPDTLPLPRGVSLSSSYPLALEWIKHVERADAATGKRLSSEPLGAREVRIAPDGSPLLLPAGGTSDRGGAFVAAPKLFRFTRDKGGSQVVFAGKKLLQTPFDAWVLGEHWTEREVILVVSASRKGEPDRVHILRVPRPADARPPTSAPF